MPARLPANWRPGRPQQPSHTVKKARLPRGAREEPRPDLRLSGELIPGVRWGRVHLWKCMGYTYISGCGVQFYRAGWKPTNGKQEKCPRCWNEQD